ncbi:MAG TPA: hypothetical protein VII56_12760 [Rhizomicrobium sp.]
MPRIFSMRGLVLWSMALAGLFALASRPGTAAIFFIVSVCFWIVGGFQKVFQRPVKVQKPRVAEIAVQPIDGQHDRDIADCVGRLDPAWQVWLHREAKG